MRPQNIEDAALVDTADTDSVIDATVELREDLGPEVDVHVGIDAPVPALEAVIEATESADAWAGPAWPGGPKASSSPDWAPAPRRARASRVKLWLDPRALHFFDPDSGAAIYD